MKSVIVFDNVQIAKIGVLTLNNIKNGKLYCKFNRYNSYFTEKLI